MVSIRGALAVAMGFLLAGCDLGSTTIPLSEPELVVHAVLNPATRNQVILLEESLTGKPVGPGPFDPANPIATGRGIPVTGAIVELIDPDGVTLGATEQMSSGRPTGIYTVQADIRPGAKYRLSIDALGKTVTGSTVVPNAAPPVGTPSATFNRDHQSVSLPIKEVDLARAYWVRIEAPLSAFMLFTTDREVAISGDTRNLFTDDLVRLFFPGFQQTLTVAAVDTNLYDYYRSGSDPFSGVGLISHLEGGIGVFGSIAVFDRRILDVTQDPSGDPVEGTYTLRSGSSVPHTLRLYLESRAPSPGGEDRISGTYLIGSLISPARGAVLGRRIGGDSLNAILYRPLSTRELAGGFAARIRGDTLYATIEAENPSGGSSSGKVIYVRQGR